MKKSLCALLFCVLLLGFAAFPAAAAEEDMFFTLRSIDITITRDREFKIGEAAGEQLEGWNISFTTPSGSTELIYSASLG